MMMMMMMMMITMMVLTPDALDQLLELSLIDMFLD
jgi:hypothetical protein